ncbi:hypothetical protein MLD38_033100 [Melastoma candidum]|uniref:Uncharacterized protein n=1 Tax=Melastoma candidum TaxID=119954 RepID=A0ACB9M5Q3_9MYRT|nr:hypothetical protein MLD38_033100 [Melastoma candidum]
MDVDLPKLASSSAPVTLTRWPRCRPLYHSSRGADEQIRVFPKVRIPEIYHEKGTCFELAYQMSVLFSITGSQKISMPMTIVMSGIAKMFVGELVETGSEALPITKMKLIVMAERKESGPIRPCHIRESYRRLKLEGKLPKRSVPRLFR